MLGHSKKDWSVTDWINDNEKDGEGDDEGFNNDLVFGKEKARSPAFKDEKLVKRNSA